MNAAHTMEGACLCGTVRVKVRAAKDVEACHCGMCLRWGGGPLLVIHCGDDVQIEGRDKVTTFRSSDWAERGFCAGCGTHLFYHSVPANQYVVMAGLFQDQQDFELKEQIFIDKKPVWYTFANATALLTEAEVFAKFSPA